MAAHFPRTFHNRNFDVRGETQAQRRGTRTPTGSGWAFQDRPRTQTWTQAPTSRRVYGQTGTHRYPSSGPRRPQSGNGYTQSRVNQRVDTANEQFGLMISLIFEICQLRHHAANWLLLLPRSIDKTIDNLFNYINLPRPNEVLTNRKIVLKNILKHDLQETAQSHIQSQLDSALNKIKLIDPTDKDRCKHIVQRKLTHNIARINRVNLDAWIDECISLVGTQYTRATRSYSDAVRENIERGQSGATNAQRTIASNTPHNNNMNALNEITLTKRPKRQLPVSPPIQVSNRFNVLRDLESDNPRKVPRLTVNEAVCIACTRTVPACRVGSRRRQASTEPEADASAVVSSSAAEVASSTAAEVAAASAEVAAAAKVAHAATAAATTAGMTAATEVVGATAAATEAVVVAAANVATGGLTAAGGACAVATAGVAAAGPTATGGAVAAAAAAKVIATAVAAGADAARVASAEASAAVAGAVAAAGVRAAEIAVAADAGAADASAGTVAIETDEEFAAAAAAAEFRISASQGERRRSSEIRGCLSRSLSQPTRDSSVRRSRGYDTVVSDNGYTLIHEGWAKNTSILRVRPNTMHVILADSNFRFHRVKHEDYEVHVFPGANLSHACAILKNFEIPHTVQNVIICVGMNNRSWKYHVSTAPDLRKLVAATKKFWQKSYFLGVSMPRLMNQEESDNVARLNEDARGRFGDRFIPPLPQDQVRMATGDKYGIHHDEETVRKVFQSIDDEISSFYA